MAALLQGLQLSPARAAETEEGDAWVSCLCHAGYVGAFENRHDQTVTSYVSGSEQYTSGQVGHVTARFAQLISVSCLHSCSHAPGAESSVPTAACRLAGLRACDSMFMCVDVCVCGSQGSQEYLGDRGRAARVLVPR